jgi:CheY-like chemotaxis protein
LLLKQEAVDGLELATQLAEMGLTVVAANDADEAILILDRHPEIELLLIDMWMPGGSMVGRQLARQVCGRWPPLKIIVMSELINVELSDLPLDSILGKALWTGGPDGRVGAFDKRSRDLVEPGCSLWPSGGLIGHRQAGLSFSPW